ncbi:MAG TPA: hypothetical protein VKE40_16475 [Gemmataceae bacterium]|nr:hypothetical protein [Gemmataceae bacterium]
MYRIPILVFAWALIGADRGRPADPPTLEQLIAQLGSKSFAEREKATQLLRERGPEALPALRKALASKDEEVRKRAEGLIPGLEINEALLPKRVTLKMKDRDLDDVLREITKQTGYKLGIGAQPDSRKVTADLQDVPFWEAIDLIREQTAKDIYDGGTETWRLKPGENRSPFVNVRGPFRLEATWFHEDRDIDFTRAGPGKVGRRSHQLTLLVRVLAEPRLTFLRVSPAKVDEAIDSEGESLLEPSPQPKKAEVPPGEKPPLPSDEAAAIPPDRGTFRGESLQASDVRLRRASETAKTIKLVRGTIPVKAILIRKPVEVTSKVMESTGTTFRAGDESLQITRVQNQGGGSIEVQIQVPREHDQNWQWYERFHLEDDAGNQFQDHGRGSQSNGQKYWISIYYGPPNGKAVGPPTKLIFQDWVVHEHAIPFQFRDVPLP